MSSLNLIAEAAPGTPSAGSVAIYPKADKLLYYKDDAGTERATGAPYNGTLGATTPAAATVTTLNATGAVTGSLLPPVFGRVTATGDISTTSTTLVDATGITVTFTTGAFPVAWGVAQSYFHSATNGLTYFNVDIDGSLQLGTNGLQMYEYNEGYSMNGSFSGQSAALSAGSHTIKERWRVGAGTGSIRGDSGISNIFYAMEIR